MFVIGPVVVVVVVVVVDMSDILSTVIEIDDIIITIIMLLFFACTIHIARTPQQPQSIETVLRIKVPLFLLPLSIDIGQTPHQLVFDQLRSPKERFVMFVIDPFGMPTAMTTGAAA
jgi:hypothetical protein